MDFYYDKADAVYVASGQLMGGWMDTHCGFIILAACHHWLPVLSVSFAVTFGRRQIR